MTTTRRSPATLQPAKPLSAPAPVGERSLAAAMVERFSSVEALIDRYRDDPVHREARTNDSHRADAPR